MPLCPPSSPGHGCTAAALAMALLPWLAGCLATAPVVPPGPVLSTNTSGLPVSVARLPAAPAASAPNAHVRLRAAVPAGQTAVLVQMVDAEQCKQPHLVGRAAVGNATPESLPLAAGKLVTLDFVYSDSSRMLCGARWSFTPQAGRQYLVQGASFGSICPTTLTDVTQADRPRTPDDLRYRRDGNNVCVPMASAKRVPPGMLEGGQVGGEAVLRPLATDEDLKGLITP